jgi:serine O-acetyltransferase
MVAAIIIRGVPKLLSTGLSNNLNVDNRFIQPDWKREAQERWWHPSAQLLSALRNYQALRRRGGWHSRFLTSWYVLQHRFWQAVAGADIPLNCQIQGGLLLPHPNGIVIHPRASIGANCLILQQVTIVEGVRIGNHVDIGAGAKIIRPVNIGDRAKIGANAVVIEDIPPGATAVGIPARIINKSEVRS